MSEAKRQQLIDSGQLNPDGTRTQACPTCGRPFAEGEALVAPEPVQVGVTPTEGEGA